MGEKFPFQTGYEPQVNHKDANKENNDLSNLEWATNSENHAHKMNLGPNISPRVEASRRAIIEEDACCIYMDERSKKIIAEEYGVSIDTVYAIKGKRNWKYATEGMDAIGYSNI